MSDFLKHECGIAMIRLLKPISYYKEKYGSSLYGFNKLFLLMEELQILFYKKITKCIETDKGRMGL